MIFLTLALICAAATCFHLYLYSKDKKKELNLEIEKRLAVENKIKKLALDIKDFDEVNGVLHETVESQKHSLQKLHSKNREAFSQIDLLNEKIEAQEISYAKLLAENEKLSQKELIEECRVFYNALEQRKKDILAALNSLESSFNSVKRVYSAQTTVDDCITTIKKTPVELQTVSVSGQYDAKHIGTSWPYESKFWNGDSE